MHSTDRDKLLTHLRSMKETDLHIEVIQPLLEAMGALNIRYVHGPSERGKDFIYIMPIPHRRPRLAVCQVKNDILSGRATDPGNMTAVLTQLTQCRKVEVL